MHPGRGTARTLSVLIATSLVNALPGQAVCDPGLNLIGEPCICTTVELEVTNNPGCLNLVLVSLTPGPSPGPGGIVLPASPPFSAIYFGASTGAPVRIPFSFPCLTKYVGVPLVAFNLSLDGSGLLVSPPVAMTICGGQLGDRVWCDTDNDGQQDPGEPGLPGITVELDCGPAGPVTTTTTDGNGLYLFERLPLLSCMISVDPSSALPLRKVPGLDCPTELLVDLLAVGPTYLDADFCFVDCEPCGGGVTALRLRYTGPVAANIAVLDRDNNQVFAGLVQPDGTFAFRGVRSDGTLGSSTTVLVDGVPTSIHTSCSQPIGPGAVFGSVTVVSGESRDGGPMCPPSPCAAGKPCSLTLRYTGESCAATRHSMDPSKVTCSGDPALASLVRIRGSNKEDPNAGDAKVWFDGMVDLNATFALESYNAGESKLENDTWLHVFDGSGQLLQTVKFHTSCSQPLIIGDQYGSARLEAFSAEGQCTDPNLCGAGDKPCSLTLLYTGESCAATSHHQDPGRVSCSGDPGFATPVRIRASDDQDPNAGGARVWFDGPVSLGSTFELLASAANENRLASATWIHVFDASGLLLQTVEFHTSCSQPLVLGDQFGSVRLEGFVPEGLCAGGGPGNPDLCNGGRPQTITMTYTGESCAASNNIQDPSKWSCSGDPAMAPVVDILVTDDADPLATGANVWFHGSVALGSDFVIDARNVPGETRLDTNTYVYVFAGTSLLQSVRFHTSCSQPLRVDDQWGSLRLVGLTLD